MVFTTWYLAYEYRYHIYIYIYHVILPVVPHKAVAEVSKIANYRRLVAVNHGSQSEPTDGPITGWRLRSVVVVVVGLVVGVVVVVQ